MSSAGPAADGPGRAAAGTVSAGVRCRLARYRLALCWPALCRPALCRPALCRPALCRPAQRRPARCPNAQCRPAQPGSASPVRAPWGPSGDPRLVRGHLVGGHLVRGRCGRLVGSRLVCGRHVRGGLVREHLGGAGAVRRGTARHQDVARVAGGGEFRGLAVRPDFTVRAAVRVLAVRPVGAEGRVLVRGRRGERHGAQHAGHRAGDRVGLPRDSRRRRRPAGLGAAQPGVPEHCQQQEEPEQGQRPRHDRGGRRRGPVRQVGVRRVQRARGGRRGQQHQQGQPGEGPYDPAGPAQRQHRRRRDHQYRVEHRRVDPGQFRRDTRLQRDRVNAAVGQHECGGGQHHHPERYGHQGEQAQNAMGLRGRGGAQRRTPC